MSSESNRLCFAMVGLAFSLVFVLPPSVFSQTQKVQASRSPGVSGALCDLGLDRCSQDQLTVKQLAKSLTLGAQVNADLEALYQRHRQMGRDLKVVIISRAGTDLTSFSLLKEKNDRESLSDMIHRLTSETVENWPITYDGGGPPSGWIAKQVLDANVSSNEVLKYSHAGIAFRNIVVHDEEGKKIQGPGTGRWTVAQLLYGCKSPEGATDLDSKVRASRIYFDSVHRFFSDKLVDYRAQLVIPTQDVQDRIEASLTRRNRVGLQPIFDSNQMVPHYNAIARFTDLDQQNSNQFVIEAIASTLGSDSHRISSRENTIGILMRTGFSPTKLTPNGLAVALTSTTIQKWFSNWLPTMCFKGQPEIAKYDIGELVTTNSMIKWMAGNSMLEDVIESIASKEQLDKIDRSIVGGKN